MMLSFANATLFDVLDLFPRARDNRPGNTLQFANHRRPRLAEAVGQLVINPVDCTPPTYEDAERWDGLS